MEVAIDIVPVLRRRVRIRVGASRVCATIAVAEMPAILVAVDLWERSARRATALSGEPGAARARAPAAEGPGARRKRVEASW